MIYFNRLEQICRKRVEELGLVDEKYAVRLKEELNEIKKKGEDEAKYFLVFHDKGVKVEENEHNLMIVYLLGICNSFNIDKTASYTEADLPDVDIDYHPNIRNYLKDDYTFKKYGKDHVCNIATYQTYSVKSSLIDMARVFCRERDEVLKITTRMGLKGDEGEDITFESLEDTFELIKEKEKTRKNLTKYEQIAKELSDYKERHPDVWDAAKRLVSATGIDWKKYKYGKPPRRKRGMGLHASAVIISNVRLCEFVPLVVPPGKIEEGIQAAAWVEGQSDTDCSAVGLVKFDYLGLEANAKIAECSRLIIQRHGLKSICALPGLSNWSDTSYLDDPKVMAVANEGDLKGIFQFDSPGIRKLVKKGGVACFDDIMAYLALYRPAVLDQDLHVEYCDRKNGRKDYEIHPILKPFLVSTYGIPIYQESVIRILNIVGGIPMKDCDAVRKAISKKKSDVIAKYKEIFVTNGCKVLGESVEYLEKMFAEIESWSGYGFNKSLTEDTLILTPQGLKALQYFKPGDKVYTVDEDGNTVETDVISLHDHGIIDGYEVTFDDGYKVICSQDHKFLTEKGQMSLKNICRSRSSILCDQDRGDGNSRSEKGRASGEVWKDIDNKGIVARPPYNLRTMYIPQMEIGTWRATLPLSMWDRIQVLKGEGESSSFTVRGMSENKERKHQIKDVEAEYGEFGSREKSYFLRNGKENICPTRNPSTESREIEGMERGESRGICEISRCCAQKSKKKFQNGDMAWGEIGLGNVVHSLWRSPKASGFCQRKDMDRSGWFLSFFRESTFDTEREKETACSRGCSREGCDAQYGGETAEGYNVNPPKHAVFCLFNGVDEKRMVPDAPGYAGISDTGRLVSRRIVRVVPVGKRRMYDLEVASNTHNFLLPNGIVTSNSHSCEYGVVAVRQLWQKVYYPLEFYTSALMSLGTADERIIDYIRDARRHKIFVNEIDINKSKEDFDIVDDQIYYGFGKVKGIGNAAKDVVAMQPYASFHDFIDRYGMDAKVIQPLIALGAFKEKDPYILYKYCEAYGKKKKQKGDRRQRHSNALKRYFDELESLLNGQKWEHGFDDNYLGKLRTMLDDDQWRALCKLKKKYDNCIATFETKDAVEIDIPLDGFDPSSVTTVKGNEKRNERMLPLLKDVCKAQVEFYGFTWFNDFERCERHQGDQTFEDYDIDRNDPQPVEVRIETVDNVTSKSGKMTYWKLRVVDANDMRASVSVWEHDYERFERHLQPGNIVRLSLMPPKPPYPNYSLEGLMPWEMRGRKNPYGDPEHDLRVVLLKKAGK